MNKRRILIASAVVAGAWFALWFCLANPFNIFVSRSERFSMKTFRSFGPGDSISAAITAMGPAVTAVRVRPEDSSCPGCVRYCFMGEPPEGVVGFQEAWLIADQKGTIVSVFINTEP